MTTLAQPQVFSAPGRPAVGMEGVKFFGNRGLASRSLLRPGVIAEAGLTGS
jgi:hypothetical protein